MSNPFILTFPHLVYNIRNVIRDNRSDDIKITDRQLEFIINYTRALLIKQDIDKKRPISSNIIQDLGEVDLVKIDASEIDGLPSNRIVLRTTNPIPKLIELSNKDAIIYVGGLDKVSNIDFTSKAQANHNLNSKYGSKLPMCYYRNGYIYIVNYPKNTKYINIEGIFADPREVSKYQHSDTPCYNITTDPYPISDYMAKALTKMIISEELTFFLQMVPDDVNDAADNDQNPLKGRSESQKQE